MTLQDERWMKEALRESKKAYAINEVPVGAIIVCNNTIIGRGHNQVEMLSDATAHAEMLAIGSASAYLSSWRLENCTLYSTLEPCSMCAGAILLSRIQRLVWAAPDVRHGACGSFVNLFSVNHPTHSCVVDSGCMKEESSQNMIAFFREQRAKKTTE
ncbi:MAG: tRNA adenosine(34) deaminase TadA [Chlamydia sp.]